MDRRNETIRKKAIKRTILEVFVLDLIMLGAMRVLLGPFWNVFPNKNWNEYYIIFIIVLFFIVDVCTFLVWVKANKENYAEKYSIYYVNKNILFCGPIEVLPIDAKAYNKFVLNLSQRAKFHAIYNDEVDNYITIVVQYNDEIYGEEFDKITKSSFLKYYRVVDHNDKEEK